MLWSNKKLTQSVTFTEDAADQTLIEAIEKELAVTKYQTFSNLCKQALWQFLNISEGVSSPPVPRHSDGLEGQIYQLQQQLVQLEQKVLAEELNRFNQLQQQLMQLTQQINQLQSTASHRPIVPIVQAAQSQPPAKQSTLETAQRKSDLTANIEHSDPVLARLSALVDDF
ncbi:MAG: hypothetical protein ACRC8A_07335 [Microcoleaceae cyanobacterium]